ncbi:RNA polymerase sigma-70 factor [Mucilaginibacter sp. ZT4R22]|uniref:RNA polymerase sigma-70 factor n=1 Tax=Mucilaginibacter pankratovii TaxID=2772110 RepID=A0ABR7WK32_9SPHI|nr:RNA polymerase sigma-70 factor [Mucilaginibacter pankratovii]MBD1362680.1 RNA polymerase sigma-70 factor [Mucilaginibacter pankratovii]
MADYGTYSDADLTELLRSGDRYAFTEIYNRYKLVLHNHAWNKTRNTEETQDAIQEVFSTLWTKREVIQIGNNLSGYLYTSVRNHILNLFAKKQVREKYIHSIQQYSLQKTAITDHRVRESMLRDAIEREIAELPPRMREVFELSRKQHLSHKEIAAIMGTTEQTVKKQVSNALKQLRTKLGLIQYIYLLWMLKH